MLDSLRYTSALSVGLAIEFVTITSRVAVVKLIDGSIEMPRLMPELVVQTSFCKHFTTNLILVTAYICHHNSFDAAQHKILLDTYLDNKV